MKNESSRKEREFARREQDILAAALSLFEGSDWQSVTVEHIAKQAGIGKGTVYKHFSCKEEIYARIALAHFGGYEKLWLAIDHEQSAIDWLSQVIEQSLLTSIAHPVAAKIAHYCKRTDFKQRLSPELTAAFERFDKKCDDIFEKVLEMGMKKGEIPVQPIEEIALALHANFHGALAMIWDGDLQQYGTVKQEDFIRITTKFMIAGILGYQG
ncbi:TetR/AcrR family transcriptional regulator [Parashewanella spongiae]|uniref:TetR/AcrR family transcriptional regulator n=1 Tax=Parashewanella spongiae TaxID=342950 RepID=A0A3A6UCF7_9GAMM|nr:TetR/AcrR family transcriptional regulator [Parashewanella spongiae]MCL1076768.1 TetR/AcrR family transcriptional regulator [Parashewanella spongiae]RJY19307.1 TetR/AcrR family transcriptional regulator [Parashewanella spongiae]